VPPAADAGAAREAVDALDALRARAAAVEEDLLAGLAVLGEPLPQRAVDDWVDQVVDTLRAVAEEAGTQRELLGRYAAGAGPGSGSRPAGSGSRPAGSGARPATRPGGDR
jgi:hypothetical protein